MELVGGLILCFVLLVFSYLDKPASEFKQVSVTVAHLVGSAGHKL